MKTPLVSFPGSHVGDNVRISNLFDIYAKVIADNDGNYYTVSANSDPGVIFQGPYEVTPIAEPGSAGGASASIVAQVTPAGAVPLTIRGLPSGTPATGFYLDRVLQYPMIRLDCPRSLLLVVVASGGSPSTASVVSVSGADQWGQLMTASFTIPAGLTSTTYYNLTGTSVSNATPKCFSYIKSAATSAGTGCPIWIGVGGCFELPYWIPDGSYITQATYIGVIDHLNDFYISPIFNFDPTAVPPDPALTLILAPTATSSNVRGGLIVTSADNYTDITGVDPLTIHYAPYLSTAQGNWYFQPGVSTKISGGTWFSYPDEVKSLFAIGTPQYYNATLA